MKKLFLFFTVLSSFLCFGQTQKIRAYLDDKQFYAPEVGGYVEIQMQFVGYSVQYKIVENGLIGEIAVRLSVKSNDSIVAADAYRLQTPLMKDSIIEDFYDIKRFVLKPGSYTLDIELEDLNSKGESVKASKPIYVEKLIDNIFISDIQIAETVTKGGDNSIFVKSGYSIIPRLSTFYPTEMTTLPVYLEIYNSKQLSDSVFGLKQTITEIMTGKEIENFTLFSRHKRSDVVPVLRPIDISTLPSGKYSLDYSIISRDFIELTKKSYEFERSNESETPFDPEFVLIDPAFQASIPDDSLDYYLSSLIPISKSHEIKSILSLLKSKDKLLVRKHFQGFWIVTAGANSYEAWMKYKATVQYVEAMYGNNFQDGFETDRGRVYLQYGAPTSVIQKEYSSTEYPYEIWQYNKIAKTSNKRFIFYNPDIVNKTYRLLHSDLIGEVKNSAWQLMICKRNTVNGNIDDPNQNVEKTWGGNSNNNFRQY